MILCRNERPTAINDESVIITPRSDDKNVLLCVQTNLTERPSCGLLNLDVPHNNLIVEALKVGIGCRQDTLKETNKPARL
jgi:hypothetical protein